MTETAVREAFATQAEWCAKLGSPFTALLCATAAVRLDRSTAAGRRLLDWQGRADGLGDSIPLRLAGSLHALVRCGAAPALAALYPPNPLPSADALWNEVAAALVEHETYILSRLERTPQTNEVGRAGPLMAGLLTIAAETALPLSLYELGASGGLNLNLDRFGYRLGRLACGDAASPVQIRPEWEGPSPPDAPVRILARRGVDLSPVDVANPDQRELLAAYVWPDQTERLARTLAAIWIAETNPPPLDRAEAADWLERVLALEPEAGVARVVYHTIAFQYFPPDSQARIERHLRSVGERAEKDAPLAWLAYENDPAFGNASSLRLTLWPGGAARVLGVGHPHGSSFRFF